MGRPGPRLCAVAAVLLLLSGASTPALAQKPKLRVWLLRTYVPDANRALEATIAEWGRQKNADTTIEYFTFDDIET